MNWLLLAVVAFLFLAAWDGHRKGFIKKSVGIVSMILTLAVTSIATPYIAKFLQEQTALDSVLQKGIASSEIDVFETLEAIGLGEVIGDYLADMILQVAAFQITLMLVGVLVHGIAFSLGIAARLPVLHGINKMAGLALGLVEGVLVVWVLFLAITAFSTTTLGGELLVMISDSSLLSWIYRKNFLFLFLKKI